MSSIVYRVADLPISFKAGDTVPLNDVMVSSTLSAYSHDDALSLAYRLAYASLGCTWYALFRDLVVGDWVVIQAVKYDGVNWIVSK